MRLSTKIILTFIVTLLFISIPVTGIILPKTFPALQILEASLGIIIVIVLGVRTMEEK